MYRFAYIAKIYNSLLLKHNILTHIRMYDTNNVRLNDYMYICTEVLVTVICQHPCSFFLRKTQKRHLVTQRARLPLCASLVTSE